MVDTEVDRRTVLLGIGGVSIMTIGGVGTVGADDDADDRDDEPETARLRVAHASPDAPNVDVFARAEDDDEGGFTKLLEDVPFTAVSEYLEVAATEYVVKISPAGAGVENAVLTTELDLEEGGDVTAAAIGEVTSDDTDFELLVLEDDNGVLDTDTARIRVVHASPDAPGVDVTVDGGALTLFDGVTFGESGGYVEVPAAADGTTYGVEVRPDSEDNDAEPVFQQDLTVAGGEVYTVFAEGYLSADDEPIGNTMERTFRLVVANDASPAPATVTFTDQTVDGDDDEVEVEVAQASLSEGGFVVIHNETLLDGEVVGSIIGNSDYLEPGTSTEIEIEVAADGIVDANGDGTTTLIAMAHRDTDGDEEYGFPGEDEDETVDGPYIDPDDTNGDGTAAVIDPAAITVEEDEEDDDDEERDEEDEDERDDDDGGRDEDEQEEQEDEDEDGEDEEDEEEEEDEDDEDDRGRDGDRGRGRGDEGRDRGDD